MHIVVTEVDHITRIPCTVEPQRTGPSMLTEGGPYHWDEATTSWAAIATQPE
jgi:hypothetical protein